MTRKELDALARSFEEMYKYYRGWHFAYAHEGTFVYYQMGGDLSVFFTPDFSGPGKVSIQIHTSDGQVIESKEANYHPPIDAHLLFAIVRPYLEANMKW